MPAASYLTWGSTSATLNIGDTISVSYTDDLGFSPNSAGVEHRLNGIATANVVAASSLVEFTGVTAGSVTIPADVDIGNGVITSNALTLTVTAPVDDDKFLNKRGLTHFWENIDDLKLDTDGTAYRTAAIPYGQCDSTSTSTAFTATVPGVTELRDGVCMWLKNGVVTSASGFTINVNNLGAKRVYSNMSAASAEGTLFNVNYTFMFVYDSSRVAGGCWVLNRGYFSDANSVGYQIRTNSSTLPALQTGYRYRLWLTSVDGQNYVPINTDTGTSTTSTKSLNTTPIDPFGTIVYNSTNGTVEAGANLPNGTQWTQWALDLRYAKYPLTALTYPDPVYLQCTPQTTGGAVMNDIVQTLPTTEDGKIYIYLGNAYSTVSMELKQNHPVYYFKDGQIRQWTNAEAGGISSVAWGDITGTLSNQSDLNTALAAKADSSSLATVATTGDYDDLINKPTPITVDSALSWTSQNPVENQAIRKTIYVKNSSDDREAGINIAFSNPNLNPYVHIGSKTSATKGIKSVGIGYNAESSGVRSVAIGDSATATKREGVALGPSASAGQYSLSIGYYTETVPNYSTAVGPYAKVLTGATNATAIGYQSEASEAETVSVGNSTNKRRIVNVANGTTASDVATVGQIPTKTSDLTNDGADNTSTYVEADELATVATSGLYNDLSNKPTIPTAGTITSGSTGYATGGDVYTAIGNVETILQTLNNGGGAQ